MNKEVIYGFIAGLHLGRFTGFISNVAITGIVLYFTEPDFYSEEHLKNITQTVLSLVVKK